VVNIYHYIFTVFTSLIRLSLWESSYENRVPLALTDTDLPLPDFRSSTLRNLNIRVQCFDCCLFLLDGRFNQLHTLYIDLVHIRSPCEIHNQV
jgi:hypothetical protein